MSSLTFGAGLITGMIIAMVIHKGIALLDLVVNRTPRLCDRCGAERRQEG